MRPMIPAYIGIDLWRSAEFAHPKDECLIKQPAIVQNKPGANGNIAAETVARSKPDGYSILFGPSAAMAGGKYLYKNMPVDALREFCTQYEESDYAFVTRLLAEGEWVGI